MTASGYQCQKDCRCDTDQKSGIVSLTLGKVMRVTATESRDRE